MIVSPDAALWLVPWGALPLADGKYAVEKYQIRYCISGRDLVGQATSAGRQSRQPGPLCQSRLSTWDLAEAEARTRAVLRSAAPVEQVASSRGLGSLSSLPRVGRLPGTAQEAAAIKPSVTRYAKAEAVVYEDQYALEGVFKALHGPRVLVLSTHGFFMPDQEGAAGRPGGGLAGDNAGNRGAVLTTEGKPLENPLLRCGLLLAGCNRRGEEGVEANADDGILTGLEIVGTDLRGTDLVVLSRVRDRAWAGPQWRRRGRLAAGVSVGRGQGGGRHALADSGRGDRGLDERLFRLFVAGQTKAAALRNAQLGADQSPSRGPLRRPSVLLGRFHFNRRVGRTVTLSNFTQGTYNYWILDRSYSITL